MGRAVCCGQSSGPSGELAVEETGGVVLATSDKLMATHVPMRPATSIFQGLWAQFQNWALETSWTDGLGG